MSTTYEAVGNIIAIMDTQQISDTFKKREFAVEIPDGNYSQSIKFQVVQDKTSMLDNYQVGQQVKVFFNLRGREFERKTDGSKDYWLNLDCWRMEPVESGSGGGSAGTDYSQISPAGGGQTKDDFDDVPF